MRSVAVEPCSIVLSRSASGESRFIVAHDYHLLTEAFITRLFSLKV